MPSSPFTSIRWYVVPPVFAVPSTSSAVIELNWNSKEKKVLKYSFIYQRWKDRESSVVDIWLVRIFLPVSPSGAAESGVSSVWCSISERKKPFLNKDSLSTLLSIARRELIVLTEREKHISVYSFLLPYREPFLTYQKPSYSNMYIWIPPRSKFMAEVW